MSDNHDSPKQNRGGSLVLPRIGTGGSTAASGQGKMRTLDHI